jgi:ATP-dependent RNA helicase DeaD
VAGVLLGAATILPSAVGIVLGGIAFVIGLGAFVRDVRELRRRWSDYEFSAIAAPFPADSIPPPRAYPDPVYLYLPNRGTALVSDAIDQFIAGHDLPAQIDEEPYRLPRSLKGSAPYVLPVCNHGRLVFNGKIVGMRGDPLPPGPRPAPPVRLHIARFFDAQCSNEMCTLRIAHRDTGDVFDPRQALLTDASGHLRTIGESTLADCVGISTIAVTSDGALVVVRQTSRNVASALLLAPAGSGSLDPRDLRPARAEILQDVIRRGMERELREETGIRPDEIRSTRITGFARWLERGAKPEFFGLTELSATANDLTQRRHLASDERLYTGGTLTMTVDIPALGRELVDGNDLLKAASLPARIKDDGSLPLLLALRAAALRNASGSLPRGNPPSASRRKRRVVLGRLPGPFGCSLGLDLGVDDHGGNELGAGSALRTGRLVSVPFPDLGKLLRGPARVPHRADPNPATWPRTDIRAGVKGAIGARRLTMIEDGGEGASGFADLTLAPELCRTLSVLGYQEPTPIQRTAIPPLLAGRDLVGQAATGTGKTAAFALPVLQRILREGGRAEPLALVLVPTRELAVQVCEAMHSYGQDMGARVVPVYGGQPIGRQLRALARGADIVVATPGRALDHIARGTLNLGGLEVVVLDEADEMLDMGFAEEIEAILGNTPSDRQTALFSATMPPRINGMVRRHLRNPVRVELGRQPTSARADGSLVRQTAYVVPHGYRPAALGRVLELEAPAATLVFCRTRDDVDRLTEALNGRGYHAEALHGGMDQQHRDRVMSRLRSRLIDLLVATDVAARGLDIEQLTHVVNYDVPSGPESYVHRIGRVGRAGREGTAITLAEPRELRVLKTIERVTGQPITTEKLPTVADLRARRLELTRTTLRESLLKDDLDDFQAVVAPLGDEFDPFMVALAAVKLAYETSGTPREEEEFPEVEWPPADDRRARRKTTGRDATGRDATRRDATGRDRRRGRPAAEGTTRLFVGTGRSSGVRPQDLVGAITGESYLSGRDIGAIEIADRFSLVEVPESAVDDVVAALRQTSIKGRRATVRRERYPAR